MQLTDKQWNLINEIALMVHKSDNIADMRKSFLMILRTLLDFDAASSYIAKGNNNMADPIGFGFTTEELKLYAEEYSSLDPMNPLMDFFGNSQSAIRTSDYAVISEVEESEYYKLLWKPKDIRYALMMPFCVNGKWLGSVNLFRKSDKEDFTDEEMRIAGIMREHVQTRLWREIHSSEAHGARSLADEYFLTGKECEVIDLWVNGYTDSEICDELAISKNTLKKHISNIFGKMEINSRVELLKLVGK